MKSKSTGYKLLFVWLVFLTGCCYQLKQDNKELLLSLDNRYKQVNTMLTNRRDEYKQSEKPIPVWLRLQLATLKSWKSEVDRYKLKYSEEK